MRESRIRRIQEWSDHPEDLSLRGPSPADVGELLEERATLREAVSIVHAYLDAGSPLTTTAVTSIRLLLRRALGRN